MKGKQIYAIRDEYVLPKASMFVVEGIVCRGGIMFVMRDEFVS